MAGIMTTVVVLSMDLALLVQQYIIYQLQPVFGLVLGVLKAIVWPAFLVYGLLSLWECNYVKIML